MKRGTLFTLLIFICLSAISQPNFKIGPSFFLGDLGGNRGIGRNFLKDFNLNSTGYEIGVGYKNKNFIIDVNYIYLHDADTLAKNRGGDEVDRIVRKFWFRSFLMESSLTYQINIGKIFYTKIGTGMIYLSPIAHDTSAFLSNLTEKKYSRFQPIAIFASGVHVNRNLDIQFSYRKTWTDYLDGVSRRGDSKDLDAYITISTTIYIFKDKSATDRKGRLRCPVFY